MAATPFEALNIGKRNEGPHVLVQKTHNSPDKTKTGKSLNSMDSQGQNFSLGSALRCGEASFALSGRTFRLARPSGRLVVWSGLESGQLLRSARLGSR